MKARMTTFALLAAIAAIAGNGCSCEGTTIVPQGPKLELEPEAVDFGELVVGVKKQARVKVKNGGEGVLSLSSVDLAGGAAFRIVEMPVMVLAPSAETTLTLEAKPPALGKQDGMVVLSSDDKDRSPAQVALTVRGVAVPSCEDGNVCTSDGFDFDLASCVHGFADGTACNPADKCIVGAVCSKGVCLGRTQACDDHSPCTRDLCRQSDGVCVFIPDTAGCDDRNPCTADSCGPSGCLHEPLPSGTACDDGDACTSDDACLAGQCVGRGGADGTACDDGDSCTVNDTCRGGHCGGDSLIASAPEGSKVFEFPLQRWDGAFLHRREVSMGDDGVFYALDHLPAPMQEGLIHVVTTVHQCGSSVYEFAYRPPDSFVLVRYVRREMQLTEDNTLRVVVGVRQLPENGYEPQTTSYVLEPDGDVRESRIRQIGGETGRSLLPDGSHVYGVVWPLTTGAPTNENPARQNLVVVREDRFGDVLWRHERSAQDWAEFLGTAGPRILFWSGFRFGALDFNTGETVWSVPTTHIAKEMALSTGLNLGVARVGNVSPVGGTQLVGVEILEGRQVFLFPEIEDPRYTPRTDPVIAADGRILVMMQKSTFEDQFTPQGLEWVELSADGHVISSTVLPYDFADGWEATRTEDDPYPTVADDGVAYVGYGSQFWAIDPGGGIRWTLTSTIPHAYTGTVPLLRDDGVMLISEGSRRIVGVRTNGGRMSSAGWSSFRHDRRRTNYTP